MITCDMQGGLGNIMFQVAAAYALAKRNGGEAYFDLSQNIKCCTQHFDHLSKYKNNIFQYLNDQPLKQHINHYNEPNFHYSDIPYNEDLFIHGYFQSYKYFEDQRESIIELFKPSFETLDKIDDEFGKMFWAYRTVSVHCRRGDYVKLSHIHPPQTKEYFQNAMSQFSDDTIFLVFSDDINWCKQNLKSKNIEFVDGNEDWFDLYIMSFCNDNIISNSSFSWWAAWLNEHKNKKVIAPKNWFGSSVNHDIKDLYPLSWYII